MATLKPLWLSLGDLSARLNESKAVQVACDYDGTLTPIVEHPDAARLSVRAREVLTRLASQEGVALAAVSGRRLDDLNKKLGVPGIFLTGSAGLATQREDGSRQVHLAPEQALPGELRNELDSWCTRFPGAWVEDKEFSYALHYRSVPADLQPAFGAGVRRRVRPFKGRAALVHGKRVFEVVPAVSWDKAAALGVWLEGVDRDGTLMFFGDDTSDEPVHELVRQRGGVAVAVGRTVSRAEYALQSPAEVVWFLEWLEREWAARPVPIHSAEPSVMKNA